MHFSWHFISRTRWIYVYNWSRLLQPTSCMPAFYMGEKNMRETFGSKKVFFFFWSLHPVVIIFPHTLRPQLKFYFTVWKSLKHTHNTQPTSFPLSLISVSSYVCQIDTIQGSHNLVFVFGSGHCFHAMKLKMVSTLR